MTSDHLHYLDNMGRQIYNDNDMNGNHNLQRRSIIFEDNQRNPRNRPQQYIDRGSFTDDGMAPYRKSINNNMSAYVSRKESRQQLI